ncbi:MAG: 2,3-bisphosphoglycerate-dependent phosphoglycerate mutase [Pseudomonadota bacterium]
MQNALVLVRHGQSEWNKLNLFTGWRDPDLTEQGVAEAHEAGRLLKARGFNFDIAYTSLLQRANRTLALMLGELEQTDLATHRDQALNERDYGDISGMNKDEAREKWGAEQIHIWRRSFDVPPPGGESLKDTAERVIPYYTEKIWPDLQAGKTVIVAAHGNSIRALIMHLEKLSTEEILKREVATGAPLIYQLNADGSVKTFEDLVMAPGSDREGETIDTTS